MPKKRPFRKLSIDEEICLGLERLKKRMGRHEALTPFTQWLLQQAIEQYQRGRFVKRVTGVEGINLDEQQNRRTA